MTPFPSRRLESISLSGYKSIRELNEFPMSHGLNVLIGANGAGKTNFDGNNAVCCRAKQKTNCFLDIFVLLNSVVKL